MYIVEALLQESTIRNRKIIHKMQNNNIATMLKERLKLGGAKEYKEYKEIPRDRNTVMPNKIKKRKLRTFSTRWGTIKDRFFL